MTQEYQRARVARLFGDAALKDVLPAPVKAIVGAAIPHYEEEAQAALDKLRNNQRPTPKEMGALETVIRAMRSAPTSRDGTLQDLPEHRSNDSMRAPWTAFRQRLRPLLYSVGRIDLHDGTKIATGFLVSDDLLATNRHVLDRISLGVNELEEGQAVVHFGQEWKTRTRPEDATPVSILSCAAVHPRLDIALLKVTPQKDRPPFVVSEKPVAIGDAVAALGYPMRDDERNPIFIQSIFAPAFGVKRASPGEVIGFREDLLLHDCSTLGGNSGSPVLALDNANVVGIHQSGFFMYQNEAVSGQQLGAFVKQHV